MIDCTNAVATQKVAPAPHRTSFFIRGFDALLSWIERGRQRRHLTGLSSHLLKDIGLSRADIEFEVRKRPWQE
ncbi:DUF1127 domain-containing protein [Dongia sp.]|uniref:DUF1127 domain-containing protein n=1 Tax=Dongia sp. TaxID=1977262 RepID=UPI0035AF3A0C